MTIAQAITKLRKASIKRHGEARQVRIEFRVRTYESPRSRPHAEWSASIDGADPCVGQSLEAASYFAISAMYGNPDSSAHVTRADRLLTKYR